MTQQLSMLPDAGVRIGPGEAELAADFAAWYAAYPRKESKGAARRAYARARLRVTAEVLAAGLARYRFNPERTYQPLPATWLNGERWADEPGPDLALDPWGLMAWLHAQPPPPDDALFSPAGYEVAVLGDILCAAGLRPTWRGSLDLLGAWLSAGYRPDAIAEVIAASLAAAPGEIRSLLYFDRPVRQRAWRWHAARHEWVRERP